MAEQQETDQTTKRKFRSDIFLTIGILSILIGLFTLLIPWIWGIPLTIAGIMMRRKAKRREKRKEKLPFLTRITELSPIDRLKTKFVSGDHVLGSWGHLISGAQGRGEEIFGNTDNFITQTKAPNVEKERKKLAPGIIRGLFDRKRAVI